MKKNVALVLSSGGARGIAHIGVIEALEEQGFTISSIAGSSIGAVVGGMYATGKLTAFKDWISEISRVDVLKLMDFTLSKNGFIKGEKVFTELRKIISDVDIQDLNIPFCALATDIETHSEVVFRSGSLYQAIRASVAVPTIIQPQTIGSMELVDGGVLNPIPMDAVQRTENDIVVAVNLNAPIEYEKPANLKEKETEKKREQMFKNFFDPIRQKWEELVPQNKHPKPKSGLFDLLNKSFDLTQDTLCSYMIQTHQPEILVGISRHACGIFEFYRATEMIQEGKRAFEKALKNYQEAVPNEPRKFKPQRIYV